MNSNRLVHEEAMTTPSVLRTSPPNSESTNLGEKQYVAVQAGDGVNFMPGEIQPSVMKRIEMIGKLNDRWLEYRTAGDGESLLRLAEEYAKKKMPLMANIVRKEAAECQTEQSRSQTADRRPQTVHG